MKDIDWQLVWQQAQPDSYRQSALCLMLLNGLTLAHIETLDAATLDLETRWISTPDGLTFPLVRQSVEVLTRLYAETPVLESARLHEACQALEPLESVAHRRLSGALWITNDELQVTLETTGSAEIPVLPLRFTFPFSVADRLQANEHSVIADDARDALQSAADWLIAQTSSQPRSLTQRLLGVLRQGSLVFLVVSTGVSGLNLVHNVLMGRLLSPADYSQLTFFITLQLLLGLLPSAIQTVTARFTARYYAHEDMGHLQRLKSTIARFSWRIGLLTTAGLLLVSPLLVSLFQLDSFALLFPMIIMMPFYIRMGTDRGILQGLGAYFWLSGAYLSEGVMRLGASVLLGYALLSVGRSLEGAVWGVAQSMLLTWFIGWLAMRRFSHKDDSTPATNQPEESAAWVKLGGMTALVLVGQALITNSDFLLVKNFFSPQDAGLYAAISVLGRIVYFGALPLTVMLVPLIARRQALDEPTRPILILLIGGGVLICSLLILGAALFAPLILSMLYGEAYVNAASLLAPYTLAASLYTLTNLVITYQIALGSGGETWMPILAGGAQVVAIVLLHESLAQVITIQIVLMGVLFVMVLWRVLRIRAPHADTQALMIPPEG